MARPSVKQQLAAIRQMFDYLVTGGILWTNPAASVRGPKYVVVRCGKTPVLSAEQTQKDLVPIDLKHEVYVRFSPSHRWFYFPDMETNEVLLIKGFDSTEDGRARFTAHALHLRIRRPRPLLRRERASKRACWSFMRQA
jgi:hypothetical protein